MGGLRAEREVAETGPAAKGGARSRSQEAVCCRAQGRPSFQSSFKVSSGDTDLEKQTRVDFCEFQASPVYRNSSRTARAT